MKYYVITENLNLENNQKWIIDVLANEFKEFSNLEFSNLIDSEIVWILGYNYTEINEIKKIPKKSLVVSTIHHIDLENRIQIIDYIKTIDPITTKYHTICSKTKELLKNYTDKPIITANFWINNKIYYHIKNKFELKLKWKIPTDKFLIGSFQRDTEGKKLSMKPKLSKGPDIFIKNLKELLIHRNDIHIILTGRRRNYIISELEKIKVPYSYFEMINSNELNELYNCLDLYIVSSRIEGGPRSIMECAISNTPIVSTDVGIANTILSEESLYDYNINKSFLFAKPNTEFAFYNCKKFTIENYLQTFIDSVFL